MGDNSYEGAQSNVNSDEVQGEKSYTKNVT